MNHTHDHKAYEVQCATCGRRFVAKYKRNPKLAIQCTVCRRREWAQAKARALKAAGVKPKRSAKKAQTGKEATT